MEEMKIGWKIQPLALERFFPSGQLESVTFSVSFIGLLDTCHTWVGLLGLLI